MSTNIKKRSFDDITTNCQSQNDAAPFKKSKLMQHDSIILQKPDEEENENDRNDINADEAFKRIFETLSKLNNVCGVVDKVPLCVITSISEYAKGYVLECDMCKYEAFTLQMNPIECDDDIYQGSNGKWYHPDCAGQCVCCDEYYDLSSMYDHPYDIKYLCHSCSGINAYVGCDQCGEYTHCEEMNRCHECGTRYHRDKCGKTCDECDNNYCSGCLPDHAKECEEERMYIEMQCDDCGTTIKYLRNQTAECDMPNICDQCQYDETQIMEDVEEFVNC
eukprot:38178_1